MIETKKIVVEPVAKKKKRYESSDEESQKSPTSVKNPTEPNTIQEEPSDDMAKEMSRVRAKPKPVVKAKAVIRKAGNKAKQPIIETSTESESDSESVDS